MGGIGENGQVHKASRQHGRVGDEGVEPEVAGRPRRHLGGEGGEHPGHQVDDLEAGADEQHRRHPEGARAPVGQCQDDEAGSRRRGGPRR